MKCANCGCDNSCNTLKVEIQFLKEQLVIANQTALDNRKAGAQWQEYYECAKLEISKHRK